MICMRTKVLSILIAGILSFSLAACGGSQAATSPSGANDAGSSGTAADAAPAGEGEESTAATSGNEADELAEGTDSAQENSGEASYKTADYLQEETVIADTDHYKLTVTGYDPDYAQDDQEGFLIHMIVENKEEKEYGYMVTSGSVNHAYLFSFYDAVVVPAGEKAEMDYLISSSDLEAYKVSSVDAVSIDLQAMSTELSEATESFQTDVMISLQETDVFTGTYSFSPTGMDYDAVAPCIDISEDSYDIITDNDVLTFGMRRNEDGTVFTEHGLFAGYMVHTDKSEGIKIGVTDVTVDGNVINEVDPDGSITDFPFFPHFGPNRSPNVVVPQVGFINNRIVEAYHIKDADTIQFTITILSEDDSELYSETLSYSLK